MKGVPRALKKMEMARVARSGEGLSSETSEEENNGDAQQDEAERGRGKRHWGAARRARAEQVPCGSREQAEGRRGGRDMGMESACRSGWRVPVAERERRAKSREQRKEPGRGKGVGRAGEGVRGRKGRERWNVRG